MSDEEEEVEEVGEEEVDDSKGDATASATSSADHMAPFQWYIFIFCFVVYGLFTYIRKSFLYVLSYAVREDMLNSVDVGKLLFFQGVAYTMSKFACSIASDKCNLKTWMALGMFGSGFFSLGFSDATDPTMMNFLSVLTGLSQGFAWVICIKLIREWFHPESFGVYYGTFSTIPSVMSLLGSYYASTIAEQSGWRTAIQMPAVVGMFAAPVAYYCTIHHPADIGFENNAYPLGIELKGHWSEMAGTEFMALLTLGYFFSNIAMLTVKDWGQVYLHDAKAISLRVGNNYSISIELGSMFGAVLAGALTDIFIRKKIYLQYYRKIRMFWVFVFMASGGVALNVLILGVYPETPKLLVYAIAFVLGASLQAVVTLMGIISIESAPLNKIGAVTGMMQVAAGWASVVSGVPFSLLGSHFGWTTIFMVINTLALIVFFAMVMGKDMFFTFQPLPLDDFEARRKQMEKNYWFWYPEIVPK